MKKTKKKRSDNLAIIEDKILEPYYIEIDPLNFMVKHKDQTKVIGYYSQIKNALKKIFHLQFEESLFRKKNMELKEYIIILNDMQNNFINKIESAYLKMKDKHEKNTN